ncbi:phycobilisome rod-core linker polypeptide [Myxacorys almedinensis]|uniref:Phycobilisome rod-core linker polypeptide CpcG2 n=1 Tax=Myxacorys almedinensis A TaxID=2690445 RepID=A0A8J7Z2P0_9CYAN|nr:phycobilisome rod-core linker polypeptide [Myxacorys almedinensis]NDJ18190.1 phycobilisome rod-core linker polypeptide CpcG2 [Myxacorys almedinensis A]
MPIPLLEYKPSTQNQRVEGYEVPGEDTPYIYRLENCTDQSDIADLIWAGYRQVFSEHVILKSSRQTNLESQLKNRTITVRDFIRGLAKSETFRLWVIEKNSNYRLVNLTLKRLLGRSSYNHEEELSWSIKIATLGWDRFVDAIVDSEEYSQAFGDTTVPYQRRRYNDRPFNLVTPSYADYWRDQESTNRYMWGDIANFRDMARSVTVTPVQYTPVSTANIAIPDMTRDRAVSGTAASISTASGFPLR